MIRFVVAKDSKNNVTKFSCNSTNSSKMVFTPLLLRIDSNRREQDHRIRRGWQQTI